MFHTRTFKILGNFIILLALIFSIAWVTPAHAAGILYVAPTAAGAGDCSSWANACVLQTALTNAVSADEIWVVAGVYKPTTTDPDPRTATFQLKDGVAVYGGFIGTETARDQRDPVANLTVLSGDIDNNDSQTPVITDVVAVTGNATNSYHVVSGAQWASLDSFLDGFTITAGSANGADSNNSGGGMYNYSSSSLCLTNVHLTNIIFSGNTAISGGGMYNTFNSPPLTNVTFSNNAADYGGGMYNYSNTSSLTHVTFNSNSATNYGGGIYNYAGSSQTLTTVTFSNNWAVYGGGMANDDMSNPTLTGVTFSDNSANRGGGMYNSNSSPMLESATFNNNSATVYGGGMYNFNSRVLC